VVHLLAVSKGQPAEAIGKLYQQGQRDFGENYVQELLEKASQLETLCPEIRWHFIGHLQRNKVKNLVSVVSAIHSVDSVELALEISKRWGQSGRLGNLPVFLEVNIDQEITKSGLVPEQVRAVAQTVSEIPGLSLEGLMAIPSEEGGLTGRSFRALRELEQLCRPATRGELSMGMSNDFEAAVREGATWVRLGTLLFGPRKLYDTA
jgi:pyridoxal phosphate enzyme (YggS family)